MGRIQRGVDPHEKPGSSVTYLWRYFAVTDTLHTRLPALNAFKRQHNYQGQKLDISKNTQYFGRWTPGYGSCSTHSSAQPTTQEEGGSDWIGSAPWPHNTISLQAAGASRGYLAQGHVQLGLASVTNKLISSKTWIILRSNTQGHNQCTWRKKSFHDEKFKEVVYPRSSHCS